MTLLDVGVWLAAVWGRHRHHPTARAWFDEHDRRLAMCRITQMSLLRLLSNPSVMQTDVLTRADAWSIIDDLRADARVVWADEHPDVESTWRALSARSDNSHKLWTDDYLAAFAQTSGLTLVTLDRGFGRRYPSVRVETLA